MAQADHHSSLRCGEATDSNSAAISTGTSSSCGKRRKSRYMSRARQIASPASTSTLTADTTADTDTGPFRADALSGRNASAAIVDALTNPSAPMKIT
jgi:hypothetical protein